MLRPGRRWPVVAIVSMALVAAACGDSGNDTSTGQSQGNQGSPVTGGTLIDYWNFSAGDVPHIDPGRAEEIQGAQIPNLVFDGLAEYDAKSGDLKPAVAESWSANADASVWTFKLRRGVTFSNGDPVLPSDFKYAWERMISKPLASIMAFHITETLRIKGAAAVAAGTATEMSGIKADDANLTLTVELEAPLAFAPAVTAHVSLSPVPSKVVKALPDNTKWEEGVLIGNGPYKMAEPRKADQYVKLTRNDTYYGGIYGHKAYIDNIEFRMSKDLDSAWAAFEAGQGQTGRIPPARYAEAKAKYPGHVADQATNGIYYYVFNNKDAVVGGPQNVKLRQAIALAIDKDRIAKDIYSGSRVVATGVAMPGIPGFKQGLSSYGARDINKAKTLIGEWERASGKTAASLPAIKLNFGQGAGHAEIATIIQANLQELGIKSELDAREARTYFAQMRQGQGQFLRAGWIADYNVYDNQLFPLLHSSQIGGGSNHAQWSNTKFDGLVDQARKATDTAKANQLYQEAEAVAMNEDTIIVPLVWYGGTVAWSNQVQGLTQTALEFVAYENAWIGTK